MYDVIISGGGPAGSICAYNLALKNYKILLIEKENFPRYKPCAGGISFKAFSLIPFSISEVKKEEISKVKYAFSAKDFYEYDFKETCGITVKRSEFDLKMLNLAKSLGCEVKFNEKTIDFENKEEFVLVKTDKNTYKTKILVGADGVYSKISKKIIKKRNLSFAVSAEAYVNKSKISEFKNTIFFDFGVIPKGYGWIFPKGDHLSVGVNTNSKKLKHIKHYFFNFLSLYGISKNEIKIIKAHHLPAGGKNIKILDGNVILIGDAAYLTDPLSGEGIYYALLSGSIASNVVDQYFKGEISDLSIYQKLIEEKITKDLRYALKLSKILYKFPKLTYNIFASNKEMNFLLKEVGKGKLTYKKFFLRFYKIF